MNDIPAYIALGVGILVVAGVAVMAVTAVLAGFLSCEHVRAIIEWLKRAKRPRHSQAPFFDADPDVALRVAQAIRTASEHHPAVSPFLARVAKAINRAAGLLEHLAARIAARAGDTRRPGGAA